MNDHIDDIEEMMNSTKAMRWRRTLHIKENQSPKSSITVFSSIILLGTTKDKELPKEQIILLGKTNSQELPKEQLS